MKKFNVLVISGPNLNMLEKRDPLLYGGYSLADLQNQLIEKFPQIDFVFFQSNYEGAIIDQIQNASKYHALLINAAGFTHTSIAIRDALEMLHILKVEVHLSNFKEREVFRRESLLTDVCDRVFYGKQVESYIEALNYVCMLGDNSI